MSNLIDIPTIVNTLFAFFTAGGSAATIEMLKGFTIGTLKLTELKDELLTQPEVEEAVQRYLQNPDNKNFEEKLKQVLSEAVKHHLQPVIHATKGSIAVGKMNNVEIKLKNRF